MERLYKQYDTNPVALNHREMTAAVAASSQHSSDADSGSFGADTLLQSAAPDLIQPDEEDGFMCHLGVFRRG